MFDLFVLKRINEDIRNKLLNLHVQKIYSDSNSRFILKFKSDRQLVINLSSSYSYVNIISEKPFNQINESPFLIQLRTILEKKKLVDSSIVNNDRVIKFTFFGKNQLYEDENINIYAEIMNRYSNMIVTKDNDTIICALKYSPSSIDTNHKISIGSPYTPLKNNKKNLNDVENYSLEDFRNISGVTKKLDNLIRLNNLENKSGRELESLFINSKKFYLHKDQNNVAYDYHLIKSYNNTKFNDLSQLIDTFVSYYSNENVLVGKKSNYDKLINNKISQKRNKLIKLNDDIENSKNYEVFRKKAELLQAYNYQLKNYTDKVEVFDYYDNKNIEIEVDSDKSIVENFNNYYKKYEKSKRAINEKKIQILNTNNELDRLSQLKHDLNLVNSEHDLNELLDILYDEGIIHKKRNLKKTKPSKPLKFKFNDTYFLVGKNQRQNQSLTFDKKNKNYVWFHIKAFAGSHVIMQKQLENATSEELNFGAKLALFYSEIGGKSSSAVDYTQVKYVKNPSGSTEGQVIYTHEKTIIPSVEINEILNYMV